MFYRRPTKLTQWMNRAFSRLASLGLTPSDTVSLEVKGRRSGKTRSNVVKKTAVATRQHFGVAPDAPIEQFQRIAAEHPVFRIVDAAS